MTTIAKTTQRAAGPSSLIYLLKESILILVFLYLFIFNGTSQDFVTLPVLIITIGLATAAGLLWLVRGQAAPTPLGRALLIFLAAYLLAALVSIDPRRSLEDFGWLLFMVFLFAFTADLVARGWPAELIFKCLLVAWSVVLAFVWIGPVMWYIDWLKTFPGEWLPEVIYRPAMPNTLAMALNTFLMIAAARWVYTRSVGGRVILGGVIAATLVMLYLTSSRAGWMGSAAGLGCLGLWLGRRQKLPLLAAWQWVRSRPLLLAASGLALAGVLAAAGWLLYRQTIHPTHGPLLMSRYQFWIPAIDTFLRHPILGQGPNTMSRSIIEAKTLPPGIIFVHAHSTPLNLLAETGLAGFLSAVGVAVSMALAVRRRWRQAQGSDLAVVMGASGALAAYAVHGLFDSFQTEPIGLWLLAIVLGAALGERPAVLEARREPDEGAGEESRGTETPPNWKRWLNRPWWVVALLAGGWLNLWLMHPLIVGVEAMNSGRTQEAAGWLEQAVRRDPHSAVAWQQLGLVRAALAQDEAGYRLAIQALERAAALDPAWAFTYGNLGALYRAIGDPETARRYLEQTFHLADMPVFHLNLAVIAEEQGDLETARREYAAAFEGYPGSWEGDFWQQSALRREVRAAGLRAVDLSAEQVAGLEANLAADPSTLANYLPLAEAYLRAGRMDEAARLLEKARFTTVMAGWQQAQLDRLRAEVAEVQGRGAEADAYRRQLEMNCAMQGFSGPGESVTQHYDVVAFRKPAIFIEMVPQMVRMPCP